MHSENTQQTDTYNPLVQPGLAATARLNSGSQSENNRGIQCIHRQLECVEIGFKKSLLRKIQCDDLSALVFFALYLLWPLCTDMNVSVWNCNDNTVMYS